jgi:predicted nucleic acid-binding protein
MSPRPNSLLLYVVGTASPKYIPKHKRTNNFTEEDFDLLKSIMDTFDLAFTTPQVLTETSNLLRNRRAPSDQMTREIWSVFEDFVAQTTEVYKNSASVSYSEAFERLGLTDALLAILSDANHEVLTCDAGLYYEIRSRGLSAINFNHEIDPTLA